ncbi:MAG: hypothetical protein ACR5KW_03390 [Wolbachia sp.]
MEAQKTEYSKYQLELTNSSVLTKEIKNKEGKIKEVIDQEGRNGGLLYTSNYKKLSIGFFEIRDLNGNLELDKSLISVPIVLAAGLAKICAKLLTFIPMKLGEYLINRQNSIAKFFGYFLFTPAMVVKNLVNMGATALKVLILLFVADKKKYGDAYWIMWKHQLKKYWEETKNDYSFVKEGNRLELEKEDYLECDTICGTWKELDAKRPGIERELKKRPSKSNESMDKLSKQSLEKEKSQNEINGQINDKNQESSTFYTDKVIRERQEDVKNTPSSP